jgi:phi13 family phage major tail protein
MAIAQRPRVGLKDVVYAVLDESTDVTGGTPSYGAVYPLANAIDLSFDPAGSAATLFADDGAAFTAETVGEMKISLGQADMLPEDIARILGHTYANGVVTENVGDSSPYIAIGAKMLRAGKDNGNLVYEYFWLPKVKLTKPKQDAKTKAASIEFQTPAFEGRVVKLTANNNYRTRVRTDDALASSAMLTNWFLAPVITGSADLGALSAVIAKSTTRATFTFTKVGGGNITLTQSNLTTATLPTFKGSSAVPVAGAYVITNNGTPTVTVTFTPAVAYGAVAVSGSVVPGAVRDQNGVYCAATGAVWTSD